MLRNRWLAERPGARPLLAGAAMTSAAPAELLGEAVGGGDSVFPPKLKLESGVAPDMTPDSGATLGRPRRSRGEGAQSASAPVSCSCCAIESCGA